MATSPRKGAPKAGARGRAASPRKARARAGAALVAAPLHELSRDQLSVFLYVALLPEETRALVKAQGLSVPGFRTGSLGEVERCDVIADEIRAHPAAGGDVLAALRKAFGEIPLSTWPLDAPAAGEILDVTSGDAALALALWRVLSDANPDVRGAAGPLLDRLAAHYFGPAPEGEEEGEPPSGDGRERPGSSDQAVARAEERARKAEASEQDQRRRAEEQREKLQATLRETRARESTLATDLARARDELQAALAHAGRLRDEVAGLRGSDALAEAARARGEARDLAGKVGSLEFRLERARSREEELEAEVARLRAAPEGVRPQPQHREEEQEAVAEAEWLFPIYTREFYDSLVGWDRRVQRAAFKQAQLLSADHRHPSLRALPLEGLPGYYRVRVATDVRLIYRRPERQNEVEILSLIDREDLDRYIRQAKTRG